MRFRERLATLFVLYCTPALAVTNGLRTFEAATSPLDETFNYPYKWTEYIESDGTVECGDSSLVSGVGCKGRYCGGVGLYCRLGGPFGKEVELSQKPQGISEQPKRKSYWTPEISGETKPMVCEDDYFMTGLSCSGKYCGNVAIK